MSEIAVKLPTFHADQVKAYHLKGRYKVIRCGRRWGKTAFAATIACDDALHGKSVGWFAPAYRFLSEAYAEIVDLLAPVIKSASKMEGVIRLITGGRIDFWTLENERAGRSRKYHRVIIDEAAFAGPKMMTIWEHAIEPTLLDYKGEALVLSNANGNSEENFFWRICNMQKYKFVEFHAPTQNNPYLDPQEIEEIGKSKHPMTFAQEYKAEFVDFSGVAFFDRDHLLLDGSAVEWPARCDSVYATIDTAVKSGQQHDATAVVYWALDNFQPVKLRILDYDIIQLDGDLLIHWLPGVFRRLDEMAVKCGARYGSQGAWIEDKQTGTILLQNAIRHGLPATPIDSKLTSMGKAERAVAVSGYVYQGLVKITQTALDNVGIELKGLQRNHLLAQLSNFRIGDKEGAAASDDLVDCFTYGISVGIGNSEGF